MPIERVRWQLRQTTAARVAVVQVRHNLRRERRLRWLGSIFVVIVVHARKGQQVLEWIKRELIDPS